MRQQQKKQKKKTKYVSKQQYNQQRDHFSRIQEQNVSNLLKQMSKTLTQAEEAGNIIKSYKAPQQPKLKPPYQRITFEKNKNYHQDNRNYQSNGDYRQKSRYEQKNTYKANQKYRNNNQDNHKGQKSHICQYLFRDSFQIDMDEYDLEDKIKKLKKIIKEDIKQAHNIKVIASSKFPMIFFEYQDEKSNKKYLHLRDAIKQIKALKDKRQLFQTIFERVFKPVPPKYYKMIVFALEKGKQIKVNFTKENIMNIQEGSSIMFFYMKTKMNLISFTVFDRFLRSVQFNSQFIEYFQEDHPDQYRSYKKFFGQICSVQKQSYGIDVFNNEELSSDEDTRADFDETPIYNLKAKVTKIINKQITELDKLIDEKQEIMNEEGQKDVQSQKFKKICEEYEDLTENRDNFVNTRDMICDQIKHTKKDDKQFYKVCLKKLIIAEKQLQSKLPIVTKKRKIFQLLKKKNLLIIEGETGSGKSTQLPQMLCQYYGLFDNPKARPVLVTQPRRLATRSLAERVASEMEEKVGGFVDYVASAGREPNQKAKIIFKLDRIVLDEMTEDPLLSKYSCLVIDEAHQRTISIDVILGFVKELLSKRNDFKVIVTSASMDIHLFERYFRTETLRVSGRTFPVSISYKDYTHFKEGDKNQMQRKICKAIDEEILYDNSKMKSQYKGHVLCFCSGLDEINELVKIYENKLNRNVFSVFPLHGKITPADQKKVFQDIGKHKIIFASRIAETAITIDGVRVVIDPGLDIELVYDQRYKVSSMKLQEITQSSAKQRAGRSGRTGPGHCIRLYSEDSFKKRNANKMPEIKNSSLQTVVLRLKSLKIEDVIKFPYIQAPDAESLKRSVDILTLIGALNVQQKDRQQKNKQQKNKQQKNYQQKGKQNKSQQQKSKNQKISKIGQLLVKLPIEPFLSRAIIQAIIFDKVLKNPRNIKYLPQKQLKQARQIGIKQTVVEILVLIINFSNLFFIKKDEREQGQKTKYNQFSDQDGDFFFLQNIYRKYKEMKSKYSRKDTRFRGRQDYRQINNWIRQNYLNYRALNQVNDLIRQINDILQGYQINERDYQHQYDEVKAKLQNIKSFKQIILSCLITSFSANLCKFSGNSNVGYTIVNQRRPIQIYGTSILNLLGIQADWIICYDLYTNQQGRLFCKLAHKVDYNFMKGHINNYLWNKFQIQKIQQKNPFYTQIDRTLPTKLVQQIKFDYFKSNNDTRYSFLQQSFPVINQDINKVSFYVISTDDNKQKQKNNIKDIEIILNNYLASLKLEVKKPLRHNYIGNIFIIFDKGFSIIDFDFTNKEFLIEITCHLNISFVIEIDSRTWGECITEDLRSQQKDHRRANRQKRLVFIPNMKKLKVFIQQQQNRIHFIDHLHILKLNNPQYNITFKQSLVDKRRKIPQTKILMHYFAGTCSQNNLLISYSTYPLNKLKQSIAQEQLLQIRKALNKKDRPLLKANSMRLTKKGDGINCFGCQADEYQITQQLYQLERAQLLSFKYKSPSYIKKFRQPQISEASKTDQQWKQEISDLLDDADVKKENIAINIYGRYHRGKPEQKLGAYQKTLRIDMNVIITTLDNTIYSKLKNAYDGERGLIGCQKVHIRAIYQQVIAICAQRTYYALQQEFKQFLQDYKIQYPLLNIEVIYIYSRNKHKCLIKARSSKKQDFLIPQRVISEFFSPKLIKLQYSEFRFLDKVSAGKDILDKIEDQYDYKIYFGMSKANNSLKVYCENNQLKEIQQKLKRQIGKFKHYHQDISYKGKNLNKVKQVLQNIKSKLPKQSYLQFEIKFQFRRISIVADLQTFDVVKNQIAKLTNSQKKQCDICADIMKNPYKLINCQCTFCWLCATDHIRNFRNSPDQELILCPDGSCNIPISMNDVRTLITEEQFEKICDIKIAKYIQKHKGQFFQCKYCENIFSKSQVQEAGQINCDVCGKIQCLKCGQSHPNFTCNEWKDRDYVNKFMKDLGGKQCPKCKAGIIKNGGCNHIKCPSCKIDICWNCLKQFDSGKKCYDHLAKQCGGIFDVGAR